jgi:isoquinoline 1-oxidoreductase subunit beta
MITRRGFLAASATAGGGLLLGFELLGCSKRPRGGPSAGAPGAAATPAAPAQGAALNAWIEIAPDDTVTFLVHESEMGQGVLTSFAMILGEELRPDWKKGIRSQHAPADKEKYGEQVTGGSSSVRGNFDRLRAAGAAAREMLVAAAARRFGVSPGECAADAGVVTCAKSGQKARYGELAAEAAALQPPADPQLTPPERFTIIGKGMPRLDTPDKTRGTAVFGLDVKLPGMLHAQVARCPIFGGKLKSFDAGKAKAVPGVRDVFEVPSGVAVVADNTWAAMKGREALAVTWDPQGHGALSSASIRETCLKVAKTGKAARSDGDAARALAAAPRARKLEAVYEVPFLAHAAMEPLGATVRIEGGRCEVWASTQASGPSREIAAKVTGLPYEKVEVHSTLLGGGFGRRAQTDFVEEAVHVAVKVKKPVQVVWSREDDITGGYYRPMSLSRMSAALGASGLPTAWQHQIASPSLLKQFGPLEGGLDRSALAVARDLPYGIPSVQVTYADPDLPVTLWFWRSVGASANAFVVECFLDELARLGKKDPVDFRRALLADKPRHLRVLDLAADKAGWTSAPPAGRARGVALVESFGSIVAQVAEVSIDGKDRKVRVHKVVSAIDCGFAINPDTVHAQMESGIAFGLSAALFGEITLAGGKAEQDNFDSYPVLRMRDMPACETHIVPGKPGDKLGGVGEPGVPPIAPAVANAVARLTGKPVRKLPIRLA